MDSVSVRSSEKKLLEIVSDVQLETEQRKTSSANDSWYLSFCPPLSLP